MFTLNKFEPEGTALPRRTKSLLFLFHNTNSSPLTKTWWTWRNIEENLNPKTIPPPFIPGTVRIHNVDLKAEPVTVQKDQITSSGYYVEMLALDIPLDLPSAISPEQVISITKKHVLSKSILTS